MKLLNNLSVFIAIMFTFKVNTINTIGNAVCMWIDLENNNLVDLKNLKRKGDNDLFIDFKFKKSNYLLAYNFCEDTIAINGNYKSSQMSLLNKEYEFQRIFSGGFELGNQMKYIEGDMYNGIQLIMNQGDMCDFHGKFYSVIWDLKCSMDLPKDKNIEILSYEYDDENCKLNIKSITRETCPNMNKHYYEYFSKKNIPLSVFYFIYGIFLSFFAHLNKKISTMLIALILFTNLSGFFFYILTISNVNGGLWMIITWYLLSFILTFAYSYMHYFKKRYYFFIHGFLVFIITYYFTVFTYFLFLRFIVSNPYFVFWITYVFIFLIAGTYHFSSAEFSKRTSVSLLGGYLISKSLGMIIGGFPSETLVINLVQNMEYKQLSFILDNFIYIYLGGWLIVFIASQIFYNRKKSEIYDISLEENNNNNNNNIEDNIEDNVDNIDDNLVEEDH